MKSGCASDGGGVEERASRENSHAEISGFLVLARTLSLGRARQNERIDR